MTLTNPAMLWGLLALAIPVVVHLFNFRRYRRVYFSNVDALTEQQAETRRRHTVRAWLVLLCRMAAIALLVLAFARPVLPHEGQQLQSGTTAVSIYLDNTFSTQASPADASQSGAAKVRQIAQAYGPTDRFQLLTADLRPDEMRWLDRDELLQALDAVQPSASSPMLSQVAARQAAFLRRSAAHNRHAFIVSDFQRSTSDLASIPPDSAVQLTLLPIDVGPVANLFVDTVVLDAPAYRVGGVATVEARIGNSGQADVEKVAVRLYVDGHERAMTTVDLRASSTATARLGFSIGHPGWHEAWVEITDYPVVFDDRYYLAFVAGSQVRMLAVGDPQQAMQRLMGADSLVRLESVGLGSLDLGRLSDYTTLLLSAPEALPSGVVQALAAWVRQGGTLIVTPPAARLPEGYAELLRLAGAPPLGEWTTQPVKATGVDYSHALFRDVFAATTDDLEMPTLFGRYRLAAAEGAASQGIIALPGADMLVCAPCGEGRTYLFATSLDPSCTDFAAQALFVPTLYNMALFSQPQPVASHTVDCVDPIALLSAHDPATTQLADGQGFAIRPDIQATGSGTASRLLLHEPLPHAGIYTLADERLAFNYRRAESRLDYLSPSEVADLAPHALTLPPSQRGVDALLAERRAGRALWRWCLAGALLALFAETLLLIPRKK